jgi:predicted aspartyl protease
VEFDVVAILDTGYSGALTLPSLTIAALGLVQQSTGSALLADGTQRQFALFAAEVLWENSWRAVLVSAVSHEALLGMRLLAGCEIRIAVVPNGIVEVVPLP